MQDGVQRACSDESLLGELDLDDALAGSHHVLVLDAHDTTAPNSVELGVIVVLSLESVSELLEVNEVLATDVGESDSRGVLHVDELAKVGLAADEAEGDTLLPAESGKMDDNLNRVDVVGNDDKLGLVLLNESGDVVQAELEVHWLLGLGGVLLSLTLKTKGLLLVGLGHVLSEQFKELGGLVLVESLGELVDLRRHLQSLHEDALLPLDANVARPLDETGQVLRRLDISSKTIVANVLLEERAIASGSATSTSFGFNDLLAQIGRAHV